MYDLPYYKEKDSRAIEQFMRDHPFALLAGADALGNPVATQLPLLLTERAGKWVLRGHFMRKTDHHRAFTVNENALAVFTGSHSYVSGSWYSNPHSPSTWNYMSVHARGKITFLDDAALLQVLRDTSLQFEKGDSASPTVYDNLPEALTERLNKAIVAFEIEVTQLDSVFKLSQNRDQQSYTNIIRELSLGDENARSIAAAMRANMNALFPENKD